MRNPIFDFVEEGMDADWIFRNMGFKVNFCLGLDWLDDGYDEYEENTDSWLENWNPGEADGFTLVAKYDSEDGPCAMYVKPLTFFAKALFEFGFTEAAQKASEMGDMPTQPETIQ
jgi:hypothetical protein